MKPWGAEWAQDMMRGLPFRATFPPGWLYENPSGWGPQALFEAYDQEVTDPNFRTAFLVQAWPPEADAAQYLDEQEAKLRAENAANPDSGSVEFSRVELPVGRALRVEAKTPKQALIQYYVPMASHTFAIWFTTPAAEFERRKAGLDQIAHSFRLYDGPPLGPIDLRLPPERLAPVITYLCAQRARFSREQLNAELRRYGHPVGIIGLAWAAIDYVAAHQATSQRAAIDQQMTASGWDPASVALIWEGLTAEQETTPTSAGDASE